MAIQRFFGELWFEPLAEPTLTGLLPRPFGDEQLARPARDKVGFFRQLE